MKNEIPACHSSIRRVICIERMGSIDRNLRAACTQRALRRSVNVHPWNLLPFAIQARWRGERGNFDGVSLGFTLPARVASASTRIWLGFCASDPIVKRPFTSLITRQLLLLDIGVFDNVISAGRNVQRRIRIANWSRKMRTAMIVVLLCKL